jgi:protein-S-isoprenylcysteine O-methyltransferase Ste14
LVDLGLILVFGLQHSGMARPGFKRWWTRVVPQWAERSTYVLASSLALATWLLLWEPIGGTLWRATGAVYYVVLATYFGGWLLLFYSSLLIDHLDLFGLSQAWHRFTGARHESPAFDAPGLYARVRHPIYLGWLLIVWAAPTMTYGHLLFAVGSTLYILVGARFEERDLVAEFGQRYVEYRRRTPMLIPRVSGNSDASDAERVARARAMRELP